MATFTLGIHHFGEAPTYPVLISEFGDGTEQRRLVSTNKNVIYDCTSPTLTEIKIDEYRDFFDAREGEFESFTWASPTGDLTVRFQGTMSISHHFDGWRAEFSFKVVN